METTKTIRLKGIKGDVIVNADGTEITYKGKKVRSHLVKSPNHSRGYTACSIAGRTFYVHKVVAEAWVPNSRPIKYKMVIHKDGDSLNNHHENLMWGDQSILFNNRVKLKTPGVGVTYFDETYRGSSTISYDEALKVAKRLDNGEFAKNIAKEYNVSEMSIARIRKRYCENKAASPRYDKNVKKTVLKLAKKYTASEAAKISGINYHTVYRWLKLEYGTVKVNKQFADAEK